MNDTVTSPKNVEHIKTETRLCIASEYGLECFRSWSKTRATLVIGQH